MSAFDYLLILSLIFISIVPLAIIMISSFVSKNFVEKFPKEVWKEIEKNTFGVIIKISMIIGMLMTIGLVIWKVFSLLV